MKGSEICTPLQSYTTSKTCTSQEGAWSSPHITSLTEKTTQYIHDGALQQDARFYFVVTENRAVQHNLNTTMNYMKCLGISSFAPTPESHGIRGIRIFASQVSYWMRHQASEDRESVENSNLFYSRCKIIKKGLEHPPPGKIFSIHACALSITVGIII